MRKKYIIGGSLVLILLVGIFIVNAVVVDKTTAWHSTDKILISIDGFNMTLQEAIDNDFLIDSSPVPTQHYTLEIPNPGHSANEIWVSVDGVETTLQDAISTGLCGSSSHPYTNNIDPGQFASEIEVSIDGIEMSLQEAIDTREFADCSCASDVCIGSTCSDGCGGTCPGTRQPDCGSRVCDSAPNGCGSCGTCSEPTPECNSAGTCVECLNDDDCDNLYDCSGGSCVANPSVCHDCSSFNYCWYTLVSGSPESGSIFIKWGGVFIANRVPDATRTTYTTGGYYYERGSYVGRYSSTSFYGVCRTKL